MTSADKKQQFYRIAKAALAHYNINDAELVFMAIAGNVTFRVESKKQGKFLLRLHHTVAFDRNVWSISGRKEIESELMWLSALRRDTNLIVQTPVRNQEGHFVTRGSLNEACEPIDCSVMCWIEGKHIHRVTRIHAKRLGLLVARLHEHTQRWEIPLCFARPKIDWDRLYASLIPLEKGVEIGTVCKAEYDAFCEALLRIKTVMDALCEESLAWGLIHGDLHSGNYLVYGHEIRPIDFSLCGFGYYLFEVSDVIHYLPSEYHIPFLEGYQILHQLPDDYRFAIEAFFICSMARNLAYLALNPDDYEGLSRHVRENPNHVNTYLRKYLSDQPFLFED